MELLFKIIVLSLFCYGIKVITSWGMIFHPFKTWINSITEYRDSEGRTKVLSIRKPLISCLPCMASIWGTIGFLLLTYGGIVGLMTVTIIAVSGVNCFITKIMFDDTEA